MHDKGFLLSFPVVDSHQVNGAGISAMQSSAQASSPYLGQEKPTSLPMW
jgi:hypothetical protein